jgi:RimJ/RimL family protein N-acetyltransferase
MNIPEQLDTKRLMLKIFKEGDYDNVESILTAENITSSSLISLKTSQFNNLKEFFIFILNSYNSQNPFILFSIILKSSEAFAGVCGISLDLENNECFYFLLPLYQKNGFAIEVMKKLFEFSFMENKLSTIKCFISPKNSRAWKVAERAGMMYMGTLDNNMYYLIEKKDFINRYNY